MSKLGKISVVSVIRAKSGMVCAANCGKALEGGKPVVKIGKAIYHYDVCAEKQGYKGLHIPWASEQKKERFIDPLKASKQQAGGGVKQKQKK